MFTTFDLYCFRHVLILFSFLTDCFNNPKLFRKEEPYQQDTGGWKISFIKSGKRQGLSFVEPKRAGIRDAVQKRISCLTWEKKKFKYLKVSLTVAARGWLTEHWKNSPIQRSIKKVWISTGWDNTEKQFLNLTARLNRFCQVRQNYLAEWHWLSRSFIGGVIE